MSGGRKKEDLAQACAILKWRTHSQNLNWIDLLWDNKSNFAWDMLRLKSCTHWERLIPISIWSRSTPDYHTIPHAANLKLPMGYRRLRTDTFFPETRMYLIVSSNRRAFFLSTKPSMSSSFNSPANFVEKSSMLNLSIRETPLLPYIAADSIVQRFDLEKFKTSKEMAFCGTIWTNNFHES